LCGFPGAELTAYTDSAAVGAPQTTNTAKILTQNDAAHFVSPIYSVQQSVVLYQLKYLKILQQRFINIFSQQKILSRIFLEVFTTETET
jgi:hypothetical protein